MANSFLAACLNRYEIFGSTILTESINPSRWLPISVRNKLKFETLNKENERKKEIISLMLVGIQGFNVREWTKNSNIFE